MFWTKLFCSLHDAVAEPVSTFTDECSKQTDDGVGGSVDDDGDDDSGFTDSIATAPTATAVGRCAALCAWPFYG